MMKTKVNLGDLRTAMKAALGSASKDEARPHIACVYLGASDGRLAAVGTDGHRLTRVVMDSKDIPSLFEVSVQRDEAERLLMNLRKQNESAELELTIEPLGLVVGRFGTFLTASETFPPYRKVIPKVPEEDVLVPKEGVGLNPSYLIEAAQVFAQVYGKKRGVKWYPSAHTLDPLHFVADDGGLETTVVVMPMRT